MAERRMFNQRIVGSDAFTEMPASAQVLYFHLNMNADDDGFVNSPKKIARSIGSTEKDLNLLVEKRFIIRFPSGVIVIKHWLMNNSLKKDRYKPTEYQDEYSKLYIKPNKAYTENPDHAQILEPETPVSGSTLEPEWNQSGTNLEPENPMSEQKTPVSGSTSEPQDRIGKEREGKDSIGKDSINREGGTPRQQRKEFIPPTIEEIREFCRQRGSPVDPNRFYDFFESGNWIDTKGNKVRNWKQKLISWERREVERNGGNPTGNKPVSGKDPPEDGGKGKFANFKYDV